MRKGKREELYMALTFTLECVLIENCGFTVHINCMGMFNERLENLELTEKKKREREREISDLPRYKNGN